ncbi:MAG: tetratricopeptide repeat protein [Chloroflexota bacterium]|nr:tetratricopeptide repeat protein [Chloroflexota bacterium]
MNILERLNALLGRGDATGKTGTPALRDYIETARRAKLAEDYPRALEALDNALELIKDDKDGAGAVVIFLQKADVQMRLGEFDNAQYSLEAARSKAADQKVQIAYVLVARGMLARARGQREEAHSFYEQALDIAKEINSPGAEGRAQGLRGELFLEEGNASYAAHLLREALPKLNLSADIELSPLIVGLLGEASFQNGQAQEGTALLERALRLSDQMGDKPNERRWAIALGDHFQKDARLAEAHASYRRAVRLFGEQRTTEHVLALCKLSSVCGALRNHEDSLSYAQKAVELSADTDAATQAAARGALGIALRRSGRSADAIPHLRAASEMRRGRDSIEILRALALALTETGEIEQATSVSQQAYERADQFGTPMDKALARRNLGLLQQKMGRLQDAVTTWTQALALFEEQSAHAQVALLLCDLGGVRRTLGMHQRALRDYEQALQTLNSVDSGDVETRGLVLSIAANAYAEQGDVDSADAFFNETIALAEKMGDAAAESTRRNNYGYFLTQIGRPRRAIAMLEQGLTISRARGEALTTAIQLDNLGLAHDSVSEYPQALDYHRQAVAVLETLDHPEWRASVQINLANTLLATGQMEEAGALLDEALAYARTGNGGELLVRALIAQAQLALKRPQPNAAAPLLDEAQTIARRADMRRWLAEVLSVRSEWRVAMADVEGARTAWEEAARYYNMLRMPQGKRTPSWMGS